MGWVRKEEKIPIVAGMEIDDFVAVIRPMHCD